MGKHKVLGPDTIIDDDMEKKLEGFFQLYKKKNIYKRLEIVRIISFMLLVETENDIDIDYIKNHKKDFIDYLLKNEVLEEWKTLTHQFAFGNSGYPLGKVMDEIRFIIKDYEEGSKS